MLGHTNHTHDSVARPSCERCISEDLSQDIVPLSHHDLLHYVLWLTGRSAPVSDSWAASQLLLVIEGALMAESCVKLEKGGQGIESLESGFLWAIAKD